MDALSSQANAAGYQAVLVAAANFDRFFPLLITAAGTSKPAAVLVLGAGIAGLQAIGTARRLGAVVSAYDVRPAARGEVSSLGAKFIELTSVDSGAGEGGYARALSEDEQAALQAELSAHISRHDVVITTAQVPGRRPPLMVRRDAIVAMKPGSVIVDLAASSLGGNVEGSVPDRNDRHRQRRHHHRRAQPAVGHAYGIVVVLRPQHQRSAPAPGGRRPVGHRS